MLDADKTMPTDLAECRFQIAEINVKIGEINEQLRAYDDGFAPPHFDEAWRNKACWARRAEISRKATLKAQLKFLAERASAEARENKARLIRENAEANNIENFRQRIAKLERVKRRQQAAIEARNAEHRAAIDFVRLNWPERIQDMYDAINHAREAFEPTQEDQ